MRVGLLAPPWIPVPPPRYGGTEQVLDALARGLAALGHDVLLFTVGDSTCPVPRRWLFEHPPEDPGTSAEDAAHALAGYAALRGVDVIHDHTVVGPLTAAAAAARAPVVATCHGELTPPLRRVYADIAARASVVAISADQRATAPEVPVRAVIPHGVDLDRHPVGPGGGGYLLFVGRMSPSKGVETAVRVARAAGRPLRIVTKMREAQEHRYFERRVRPLLGRDAEVLGEVALADRVALLRHADALLNPIVWHEPFGLVMPEALACGTPVLAFPHGAAPEIVDDGRTGFLCRDEADMVEAVGRLGRIERATCRAVAEARFSLQRMARDYAALYARVLAGRGGSLVALGRTEPLPT